MVSSKGGRETPERGGRKEVTGGGKREPVRSLEKATRFKDASGKNRGRKIKGRGYSRKEGRREREQHHGYGYEDRRSRERKASENVGHRGGNSRGRLY